MSPQEPLVNRVVHNFNVGQRNLEKFFNLIAREIRDGKDPRRPSQNPLRHLKIERPPNPLLPGTRHMFQHVVHGHYIRARQGPRHRKEIGNVNQIAVKFLESSAELAISAQRVLG